eukprot:CAMPEP_0178467886 /NCGR_PEP_ID=MMETSP0689_2-20121128/52640_1 /TAXON_ID=160604 /ORGANISM="Amphidinium massartii, Strain CS-259" /LENGTH=512 /DNA_ID=CAMNT_0020094935 /DNA_START=203 /DNA_END=1742 /DNA_ORIENTATION=-
MKKSKAKAKGTATTKRLREGGACLNDTSLRKRVCKEPRLQRDSEEDSINMEALKAKVVRLIELERSPVSQLQEMKVQSNTVHEADKSSSVKKAPKAQAMGASATVRTLRKDRRSVKGVVQLAALPATSSTIGVGLGRSQRLTQQSAREEERPSEGSRTVTAEQKSRMDPRQEIDRILRAEGPEEVLGVPPGAAEEEVLARWKRLVLLLHPDKLALVLDAKGMEDGAEALQRVHDAKAYVREAGQRVRCTVPAPPEFVALRPLSVIQGARKYEVQWRTPDEKDPGRPIESFEVWAPRYYTEAGEPVDWLNIVKLPISQNHFVMVEETPAQAEVMAAADRVLRPTLTLAVHACNGAGASEGCLFELPWATAFPWLRGARSVICQKCLRLKRNHQVSGLLAGAAVRVYIPSPVSLSVVQIALGWLCGPRHRGSYLAQAASRCWQRTLAMPKDRGLHQVHHPPTTGMRDTMVIGSIGEVETTRATGGGRKIIGERPLCAMLSAVHKQHHASFWHHL